MANGGTKKEACEILNIAYNTTRLNRIIKEYQDRQDAIKRRFKQNKGKPLSEVEIGEIVVGTLIGQSPSEISKYLFHTTPKINSVIKKLDIPASGEPLPDNCVLTSAKTGQLVWSSKYNKVAEVVKQTGYDSLSMPVYQVYIYEPSEHRMTGGRYAHQSIVELGSLEHLTQYFKKEQLTK